jgi:hypothetical protein
VIDPVRRRRGIAFLVALALVPGGVLWVVTSVQDRDHATDDLAAARASLREWEAAAENARSQIAGARERARNMAGEAAAVADQVALIARLDEQEASHLREAVAAARDRKVNAFNSQIGVRNSLAREHDTAVESVRAKVDALIAGLDGL